MIDKEEILKRLDELAVRKTIPFCYGCYRRAPSGVCEGCASDDLMRELAGEGVEYGTAWIHEHLVRENLTPINVEDEFEVSIRECYPETVTVGWLTLDTVTTIRDSDPVSWRCACNKWAVSEEHDGQMISFDNGSTYYRTSDVEDYLDAA